MRNLELRVIEPKKLEGDPDAKVFEVSRPEGGTVRLLVVRCQNESALARDVLRRVENLKGFADRAVVVKHDAEIELYETNVAPSRLRNEVEVPRITFDVNMTPGELGRRVEAINALAPGMGDLFRRRVESLLDEARRSLHPSDALDAATVFRPVPPKTQAR